MKLWNYGAPTARRHYVEDVKITSRIYSRSIFAYLDGFQRLHRDIGVGIDADFRCGHQRFPNHFFRAHVGVFHQTAGRRQGKGPARTDGDDAVFRFDDFARARDEEGLLFVANGQQGIELAEIFVRAPFFAQFHGGAGEILVVFLQLAFEALKQGKGIGYGTRKTGEYGVALSWRCPS